MCLEKWNLQVGCFWKESHANEAWVRVVGLPLHLWSREVFKKFGDGCEGFISEDEDTTCMTELQWARILVKLDGRSLLSSAQVVVGSGCFSILLWWEFPPWFVQVVLSLGIHVNGTTVAREEDEGNSHATCSGRSKESLVQVEARCGVQDVSPPGDLLKDGAAFAAACSARLQAVGTMKASEEGCLGVNVLTKGSNVSNRSFVGLLGSGLIGLGSGAGGVGSGSGGLGCLEAQQLFSEPSPVLSHFKTSAWSYSFCRFHCCSSW